MTTKRITLTATEKTALAMLQAAVASAAQNGESPLLSLTLNVLNQLGEGRIDRAAQCLADFSAGDGR